MVEEMEWRACVSSCSAENGSAKVRGCLSVVSVTYLKVLSSYFISLRFSRRWSLPSLCR